MQQNMFGQAPPAGVSCPWCKQFSPAAPPGADCGNCGGPLPPPPSVGRALAPPPTPRHLPERYTRARLLSKNVGALVGTVFAAFGGLFGALGVGLCFVLLPLGLGFMGFGVLFGGIGLALRSASRKDALRQIAALTYGVTAEGQVVSVGRDTSESINGRNPFLIEYVFSVNGQALGGATKGWDIVNATRQPGQPLWVVYLPNDPSVNSIWPPIS